MNGVGAHALSIAGCHINSINKLLKACIVYRHASIIRKPIPACAISTGAPDRTGKEFAPSWRASDEQHTCSFRNDTPTANIQQLFPTGGQCRIRHMHDFVMFALSNFKVKPYQKRVPTPTIRLHLASPFYALYSACRPIQTLQEG